MCKIENLINRFDKKYSESKDCHSKIGLKRFYKNKDKISNQRKVYYGKNKENLIQKQNYIYTF